MPILSNWYASVYVFGNALEYTLCILIDIMQDAAQCPAFKSVGFAYAKTGLNFGNFDFEA